MRKIVFPLLYLVLQAALVVAVATAVAVRPHVIVQRVQHSTRTLELRDEGGRDQALVAKAPSQIERVTNVFTKRLPFWIAVPRGFGWERGVSARVRDISVKNYGRTQSVRSWRRIPRMGSEEPPWQA